jgi:hypothetical protein
MRVKLLRFTPGALNLLLFTKNTRLMTEPLGVGEIDKWSPEKNSR